MLLSLPVSEHPLPIWHVIFPTPKMQQIAQPSLDIFPDPTERASSIYTPKYRSDEVWGQVRQGLGVEKIWKSISSGLDLGLGCVSLTIVL